jgi:hypothetical protein
MAKDKARDADSRLSSSTGTVKDMRAYEHDRQKVKKAAELVKRKARKASGWSRALHELKTHSSGPTASSGKRERLWLEDVDALDGLECEPDVGRMLHSLPSRGVLNKREVKLADLVTARKPRKGKDGDFEVIPHVRSVVILDDCVGLDLSEDEPWEYIRGQYEEDVIVETRSYADILSAGK